MLYKIVSGHYPFRADNPQSILAGHLMREPDPIIDLDDNAQVTPELDAIIRRCLEKDANKRFSSAIELADAIQPFISDTSLVRKVPTLESGASLPDGHTLASSLHETPTIRKEQWVLLGALVILTVGVLSISAYLLFGNWSPVDHNPVEAVEAQSTEFSPEDANSESGAMQSQPNPVEEQTQELDGEATMPILNPEGPTPPIEEPTIAPQEATTNDLPTSSNQIQESTANGELENRTDPFPNEPVNQDEGPQTDSQVAWPEDPQEIIDPWDE